MREKVPDPFIPAALGLGLVLAVLVAAAGIRLETGIPGLRIVHRVAASLEVLVVLWLAWLDWRRPAVLLAVALTAILSVAGIVGGQQPPAAIAAVNLLGGLALAATFSWMLGEKGSGPFSPKWVLTPLLALLAVQLALGTWLAIVDRVGMALAAHGLVAVALAALLAWTARGKALFLLALAAPLAGFTALHYDHSAFAALAHAAIAALLVVLAAYGFARKA